MTRTRLIAAVILALTALTALTACSPSASDTTIRSEPLRPYPEAVAVRLLINDLPPIDGEDAMFSRPEGVMLTSDQRARLEATFVQKTVRVPPPPDPNAAANACFVPHHFFQYLDAGGRVVGEISVCFCCSGVQFLPEVGRTDPGRAWVQEDIAALKALVTEMGLPVDVNCGP